MWNRRMRPLNCASISWPASHFTRYRPPLWTATTTPCRSIRSFLLNRSDSSPRYSVDGKGVDGGRHPPHLALRDFVLRRHGVFLGAFDTCGAASLQLGGTEAGHDGELECVHVARTSHHNASSPADGFGEGPE